MSDHPNSKGQQHGGSSGHHHHHILSFEAILTTGGALLFLTVLTVAVAHIDLGSANFLVALLIATIKAVLVGTIFMNLRYDRRENGLIFMTSFLFLAIFIVLTSTDLFFRGDVYVKPGALLASGNAAKSKLKSPWVATPELIAHGKELFLQNCTTCHGESGQGNGLAASGLDPKPRNFTQGQGWVNGRYPSNVFKTLKEGVAGSAMASFATLPVDDRWALVQYVLSLGPPHPQDSPETLAKIGYSPNGQATEEKELPSVPVEFALERMAQADIPLGPPVSEAASETELQQELAQSASGPTSVTAESGAQIYEARCATCHGNQGQGDIRVQAFGLYPRAYMMTRPLSLGLPSLRSADSFDQVVRDGIPGNFMPGYGQLSAAELSELYGYTRSLAQKHGSGS